MAIQLCGVAFATHRMVHHALPGVLSVILCLMCIPTSCYSFHQRHPTFTYIISKSSSRQSNIIHSTASSSADQSIYELNILDSNSNEAQEHQSENNGGNTGIELWLDLRGTSLTPKTALELWHLESQLAEAPPKAPFVKCLISSNQKSRDSTPPNNNHENEQNIDVLLVEESDDGIATIFQKGNQPIGRTITVETSSSMMPILPDPFPAMEAASKGQWVIIDTSGWNKIDEEDRIGMVLPLVELISSSCTGNGGIGLTCQTNNEVVKAAMFIQSRTNGGGSGGGERTKTLESGIVVPDDDDNAESSSILDSIRGTSGRTNYAVVVPYDMALLQTAMMLF